MVTRMEPTAETLLANITTFIGQYSGEKIALCVGMMLVAFLIGNLLRRRLVAASHPTFKKEFMVYLTPLVPPVVSLIFFSIAYGVIQAQELPSDVFQFFLKLSIAWLAVRVVMMMTTRKSAGWFIFLVIAPVTLLELFDVWAPVATALDGLKIQVGDFTITAYAVLKAVLALIVLFWVAGLVNNLVNRRIYRMDFVHYSHRTLIAKMFQIFLYFVVFIVAMHMVGIDLTALSVLGGAIGVGIGFGLQKIASNFISGIILLFERSVQVGDLVELADGTLGYIRKTGARYTLLETFDGREVLIPNEEFITQRLVSLTHNDTRARVEIIVGVKYGTDLECNIVCSMSYESDM